jgi:hypothetical protein
MSTWSDEETDDPTHADRRNFYKVEKWSKDDQRIERMLWAANSLDKAQERSSTQKSSIGRANFYVQTS